jgi:NTP pyrophosphatase (non-canonical NTP hydrolase)
MKTVKYKGLTISGPDLEVDKILYDLQDKQVKVNVEEAGFSKAVDTVFKLNNRFIPNDLDANERVMWTKQFILCMQAELIELLDALPWKHWKNYDGILIDDEEVEFEIADLFIFLIGIAGINGMSAIDIITRIMQKMDTNFKRQDRGY